MDESRQEEMLDPEWSNVFRQDTSGQESVRESLRRVPIFSLLTERELALLAKLVHLRRYVPGEVVIRPGVPQSGFYLVRSGSVAVVRQDAAGNQVVLDRLGAGALVGEFGLMDDTPRTSAVVADEQTELIGFFKPDLMGILNTRPAVGCRILLRLGEGLSERLREDYLRLRRTGYPRLETATPASPAEAS